jgi:glycine cleavage system H protein
MNVPEGLHYSSDHEWVGGGESGRVRIGITDYAQDSLGDVVFVQLPTLGDTVASGATLGEVESTKSVSDIYAPVGGTVVAINDALNESPQLLNEDPFGEGWICEIEVNDAADLGGLLDAAAYTELIEGA